MRRLVFCEEWASAVEKVRRTAGSKWFAETGGEKPLRVCGGGGAKNGASGVHVGTGRSAAVVFQFLVSSFFFCRNPVSCSFERRALNARSNFTQGSAF